MPIQTQYAILYRHIPHFKIKFRIELELYLNMHKMHIGDFEYSVEGMKYTGMTSEPRQRGKERK